tara:strand:+ start:64 stop:252 length:189 start_codon:yes stop_codon:yes gene_type:complete
MNILKQVDKTTIRLTQNGVNKTYTGYNVGDLPPSFAFMYNEDKDNFGINSWFNYKGLTYVSK